MTTGNTQSPSRQSAATPGGPGRLRKWIVAGILTTLILAVILTPGLQAPPTAEAQADTTVAANWNLIPTEPPRGGKFRLMFITATGHSPTSTDIATYNTYVQGQANASDAHADIKAYSSTFRVLGSTTAVDARDNTNTNPDTDTSVPIYWLNGEKIADDYDDLYDGSWDSEMASGRAGVPSSAQTDVWTGSENDGSAAFGFGASRAFGTTQSVRYGRLNDPNSNPFDYGSLPPSTNLPYYALSGVFVVPNTAASGVPTISGTPREDHVLTADVSGISDPNGIDPHALRYVWETYDGTWYTEINGAEGASYRTQPVDVGKPISVKVYFFDIGGNQEGALISDLTDPIVAANVLVNNTDQAIGDITATPIKEAQDFTTGPSGGGYNLNSIGVRFDEIANIATAASQLTVTLNTNNNGSPGNALCTLTDPPTFAFSGVQTFNTPTSGTTCPTLEASTTYFATIEASGTGTNAIKINTTNSFSEDSGGAPGWSVNNESHYFDAGAWASENSKVDPISWTVLEQC